MDLMRLVLPVVCLLTLTSFRLEAATSGEVLKTINLSMPTNFGTFFGEIHFSEKDRVIALKTERIIKEDLIKVINYFEYVPRDTVHFNVDPYLRLTNGNARTFPTNIINLFNFPASNLDHLVVMENWLQGLVLHEFIHITHLDQTRDYLEVGRRLFGTIAKVPTAITPRWFTEGIAVWGESYLISGGRLHHPLFNKELLIQFKKQDFCKTIDCLDDPGNYPNGELAYWAGAHFIEYLENLKPKSIKCLVEANSLALPLFLNNAFESCLGDKAQNLFIKFRDFYVANAQADSPIRTDRNEWGDKLSNVFGVDDFQKGFVLDEDRLFRVEHDKKSEALVAYDLADEVNYQAQFEFPIVDVSAMFTLNEENKMLLVSFNEDPNFRNQNKVWKLVNPDTLLIERKLDFLHDPSYVVALGGDEFVTFSYWENQWIAEKNDVLLRAFPSDMNISLVKKIGDQLLIKINDSYGTSSLVMSDVKLQRLNVVYKNTLPYDLPLISDQFLVIREGKNLSLLEWSKTLEMSTLAPDMFNQITMAQISDNRAVVLESRLKSTAMTKEMGLAKIKTGASKPVAVVATELPLPPSATESFASREAESYPRLDHLIPHYWFLAVGSSENLGSLGAMTTFVDPMEIHFLNATALVYPDPDVRKVGGSLDYVQKMIQVSDQWKFRAFLSQDYSKTEFSSKLNQEQDFTLRTYYTLLKNRWNYTPGIFGTYSTTNDFISDRTVRSVGLSQALSFQAMSFDDFFQSLSVGFNLQTNHANVGESYFVTQLTGQGMSRFTQKLTASLKGSYGKLYKNDFSRGVIYGGGTSDFANRRTHEFYGLPYSNAYGNEIFTARFTIDYNFLDVYRGKNLLPFYLKEAHLLFGRESLYADRIILGDIILRDKMINALFVGPRLKMNFFYYVPANLDLIFSTISHPNGKNVNKVDFTIMADLF